VEERGVKGRREREDSVRTQKVNHQNQRHEIFNDVKLRRQNLEIIFLKIPYTQHRRSQLEDSVISAKRDAHLKIFRQRPRRTRGGHNTFMRERRERGRPEGKLRGRGEGALLYHPPGPFLLAP
jgi:hypothetical protein